MYQFLVREKWSKFQPRKNDNFQVWKTLRNALAMMLREKSCVDLMLMAIMLRVTMRTTNVLKPAGWSWSRCQGSPKSSPREVFFLKISTIRSLELFQSCTIVVLVFF